MTFCHWQHSPYIDLMELAQKMMWMLAVQKYLCFHCYVLSLSLLPLSAITCHIPRSLALSEYVLLQKPLHYLKSLIQGAGQKHEVTNSFLHAGPWRHSRPGLMGSWQFDLLVGNLAHGKDLDLDDL